MFPLPESIEKFELLKGNRSNVPSPLPIPRTVPCIDLGLSGPNQSLIRHERMTYCMNVYKTSDGINQTISFLRLKSSVISMLIPSLDK